MNKHKKQISNLLVVAILTGFISITTATAQQTDDPVLQTDNITTTTQLTPLNPNLPGNLDSIKTPVTDIKPQWLKKVYPYAHLSSQKESPPHLPHLLPTLKNGMQGIWKAGKR